MELGNLCPGAWSISSPSFFPDLAVCRAVSLTDAPSSLQLQSCRALVFSALIKLVVPKALPASTPSDGLSLGQWQLCLGSVRHWGTF